MCLQRSRSLQGGRRISEVLRPCCYTFTTPRGRCVCAFYSICRSVTILMVMRGSVCVFLCVCVCTMQLKQKVLKTRFHTELAFPRDSTYEGIHCCVAAQQTPRRKRELRKRGKCGRNSGTRVLCARGNLGSCVRKHLPTVFELSPRLCELNERAVICFGVTGRDAAQLHASKQIQSTAHSQLAIKSVSNNGFKPTGDGKMPTRGGRVQIIGANEGKKQRITHNKLWKKGTPQPNQVRLGRVLK